MIKFQLENIAQDENEIRITPVLHKNSAGGLVLEFHNCQGERLEVLKISPKGNLTRCHISDNHACRFGLRVTTEGRIAIVNNEQRRDGCYD